MLEDHVPNGSSCSSNNLLDPNATSNAAAAVNFSSLHHPNTNHFSTPSHVGSDSIHSANTNTTTETNSLSTQAKTLLTNSVITLQDCNAKRGWKNYLLHLFVNVYWMWCLLFMPIIGDFHWGNIGKYVMINSIGFPITLMAEMIPYIGVVGLGSFMVAVIISVLFLFAISIKLANNQNKHHMKLKWLTFYGAMITKPFSLLFVYVLVGFLNCSSTMLVSDDDSSDTIASLLRYPNQACTADTTNLVMLILSIISIIVLLGCVYPLSEFITCNSNPHSQIPMLVENPMAMSVVGCLSILQLLLAQLLPSDYVFISAIVHFLLSIICCIVVFYSLPCLRMIENSLFFGVTLGRVGASIGSLVSSLANVKTTTGSIQQQEQFEMMGMGFAFMTLALVVIFFIVGTIVMELYQRLQLKRARSMFLNCVEGQENRGMTPLASIEKNAMNLYYVFEDLSKMSLLNLFVKYCLTRSIFSGGSKREDELKDCELAMSFIRGAAHQKAFNQVELLIYSALVIQTQWSDSNNYVFAMSLLKRASLQHPSIFQQLKIREKMKQIESFNAKSKSSTSNSFELTCQLDRLEKDQNNLLVLHRNFWKEMASDIINYPSLEKINRSIYSLTYDCRNTLQNLIYNNKNNKTLLRLYGNFLENFEFNSEMAHYYYNEATSIEDEEMKKKRRVASFNHASINNRRGGGGGNKVIPVSYPVDSEQHHALHDGDELESAFENPKMKKEQVFKSVITAQRSSTTTIVISLLYLLVCMALVLSSLVLSIYYSGSVKSGVPYLQQVCQPSVSPYSAIRNLRAVQNFATSFMFFGYPWPQSYVGFVLFTKPKYFVNAVVRLKDDVEVYRSLIKLAQHNVFDDGVYSDYSTNNFTINYPNENLKDVNMYDLSSVTQKNVSIVELATNMIKYTERVINEFPWDLLERAASNSSDQESLMDLAALNNYFHPMKNYNFMFLFSNVEAASTAFDTFCARYLDRSTISVSDTTQQLIYYTASVLAVFILISIAYLCFMIFEMSFLRKIVKMYEKQLSKDVIGKIFHNLNSKTTDSANASNSRFSLAKMKPNVTMVVLIILVTLFTCATIAMFYYESDLNASTTARVMNNVRLSIQIAAILQRIGFYSGEVNSYVASSEVSNNVSPLAVNFRRNVTYGDPRLLNSNTTTLFDRVTVRLPILSDMWSKLIYGDISTGTDQILGMYPNVDILINSGASTNCTEYLKKNNISLTTETNMMYCTGLETLLNDYMTLVQSVLIDSRKQYSLQQVATPKGILLPLTDIALAHNLAMRMCVALTNKFTKFIKEFVTSSSNPSYGITILFASIELVACLILFTTMYSIYMNYCGHIHSMRLMSQYIPVDVLERNETLRNFILFNTTTVSSKLKNKKEKESGSSSSISDLKNVFNSSIEGSIICNECHDIEFLNYSALKMFGMKPIDVLGVSISHLVDPSHQDELKKCIQQLFKKSGHIEKNNLNDHGGVGGSGDDHQDVENLKSTKKNNHSSGVEGNCEVIELDCVRRNQTKFPCKIILFTVKIQEGGGSMRDILIVNMKDLTSEKKQNALLSEEKLKSDNLLKNILPTSVASRLKSGHTFIAEKLPDITCFFSDMVGFTAISSTMQATDLVMMLNSIVNGFDMLTEKYDLEKIKTIGDAYFAVGGLPGAATSDHPERVLKFAIETFGVINEFNSSETPHSHSHHDQQQARNQLVKEDSDDDELEVKQLVQPQQQPEQQKISIRVGLNTGPVVAGVIGIKRFAYDLWGDTINTASRMESTSKNGRIQISRSTYERVHDLGYDFEEREIDVKGKGIVKAYLLDDKHHKQSLKNNLCNNNDNRNISTTLFGKQEEE